MKSKFKLYSIEKILFVILPFIFIINCYSYIVEEVKILPTIVSNHDEFSFVRLIMGPSATNHSRKIETESSRDIVERYIETLDEDTQKKVNEEIGAGAIYIEIDINELTSIENVNENVASPDFHHVVYGYFKEGLSEYNELKFEVLKYHRNLNILNMNYNASSYGLGVLSIRLFLILLIIDIIIRVLSFIYYKLKEMSHEK
ncbi:hypothetical protein R0131_08685 [Clostridium sp. AL.422]|uniref:hypothetical protein n=1 Tax=Clostridium TaxID=1485 RepID=UPI00293DDF1E|nr:MULTISPECIES: hypothetical protein [unclassified Clostridium]MDV4150910.1 hypothetical protein [Clostridium sp. AL.422]